MKQTFFLLTAFALASCGPSMEVTRVFDGQCWDISDTLFLEAELSEGPFGAEIELVLMQDFPYTHLHLMAVWEGPGQAPVQVPLRRALLTPGGDWLLERSGGTYTDRFVPELSLPVGKPGLYRLSLTHHMREEAICEVKSVGMRRTTSL